MSRTVIGFAPFGKSVLVSLDRAPMIRYENETRKVNLSKVDGATSMDRGAAMLRLISQRDPVRAALTAALGLPVGAPPAPLYFHVSAAAADAVRWEQIYAPPPVGFIALDPRWPVGRIARTVCTVAGQSFEPPLQIVAVLAAAGRDASEQLDGLVKARDTAPLATTLHVISGNLHTLKAAGSVGATTERIKGTAPELGAQIAAAEPQIVHLFCHGGMVVKEPTLRFATLKDVLARRRDFGSLQMNIVQLFAALDACRPWLVVLAACESAQAVPANADGRSIAHELVSAGVAAAIGIRQRIDVTDADRFCGALYPQILATAHRALYTPAGERVQGEVLLDWASALTIPRQIMSNGDPSTDETWLDPVLYAQNDELRIFSPTQTLGSVSYSALQGQRDKYREYLRTQDPKTTNPQVLALAHERIAEIDAILDRASG
jgi:hypothetical protein